MDILRRSTDGKLYLLNCLAAAKRNIRGNESPSSSVKWYEFVGEKEREKE